MIRNRDSDRARTIALTTVYGILLILLYIMIFSLSAQDGAASTDLSTKFSGKCAELLGNIAGQNRTDAFIGEAAAYFEHPLRKLAHFTEYACMGALVYLLWSLWLRRSLWLYLLPAAWVFISAGLDEFHQSFVPGRCGSFADVCLDTLGGVVGTALVVIIGRLARVIMLRRASRRAARAKKRAKGSGA